jgi:hypothetical protein
VRLDAPLLSIEGGGGKSSPATAALLENPGIPDTSAGDGHAIHARLPDHLHAGLGAEQVAAAEDHPFSDVSLDSSEEGPLAGADVTLLDGAPVDSNGGDANLESPVENAKEVALGLRAVVHPSTHLYRYGVSIADGVMNAANDFQCRVGLGQKEPSATPAKNLSHRTAEVNVDHVIPGLGHGECGRCKHLRIGPQSWPPTDDHRRARKDLSAALALLQTSFVENDFVEVRAHTRQPPHGQIAVAAEGSLHEGCFEFDVADSAFLYRQLGHAER